MAILDRFSASAVSATIAAAVLLKIFWKIDSSFRSAKRDSPPPPDAEDVVAELTSRINRDSPPEPSFEGAFGQRMVMSHLDIAQRNIIIEEGDKVCLIDWEYGGAYPPWFERVALEWSTRSDFERRVLERLPPYKEQEDKLKRISFALMVCGPMRSKK